MVYKVVYRRERDTLHFRASTHTWHVSTFVSLMKKPISISKPYSLGGGGGPKHVLHDLLEVADVLGARTVEVLLDERTHRSESVLQPSLAPLQGPSLVVHIPGVALATEDILRLMSLNWDVRGKTREDATHRQRVRPRLPTKESRLSTTYYYFISATNQPKFK